MAWYDELMEKRESMASIRYLPPSSAIACSSTAAAFLVLRADSRLDIGRGPRALDHRAVLKREIEVDILGGERTAPEDWPRLAEFGFLWRTDGVSVERESRCRRSKGLAESQGVFAKALGES